MSGQIGIPNYKDLFNKHSLNELKELLMQLDIVFMKLSGDEAIANRESDLYELYSKQYASDINNLSFLRNASQQIADICNKDLFTITDKSMKFRD